MEGGWCCLFLQSSENWKLCFVSFLLFSTVHHANLVPIHFRSVDIELRSTSLVFCLVKSAFPSWAAAFSMTCIVGGTFYQGLEYLLGSSLPFGLWWADGTLLRQARVSNVPPTSRFFLSVIMDLSPIYVWDSLSFNPNVAGKITWCLLFKKT